MSDQPRPAKTKIVMVRIHFVRPGFMLGGSTWMQADGILDRDTGVVECSIGGREFEVSRNSSVVQGLEILRK